MKLENITAELRPRSNWEAADLGAVLVRRDFASILFRQAILLIPLWGMLVFVFADHPGWALIFLWWLKPLYERISLFNLSRTLFGERVSIRDTLRAAPRIFLRDLFMGLVITRFSPSRSAFQPVNQLEGLRWGNYSRRVKLLGQYASGSGLTVVMSLLELGLILGLVSLATLLMPFTASIDWQSLVLTLLRFEAEAIPNGAFWVLNGLAATSIFLLTPFYAGAGFGIYINARSLLEGWDIELALRKLGQRLSADAGGSPARPPTPSGGKAKSAAIALLGVLGFGLITESATAAPKIKETIAEVLSEPDFEIHKVKRKFPIPKASDIDLLGEPKLNMGGSGFGTILFYILIVLGAGALVWWIWVSRHLFFGGAGGGKLDSKARTVMGMEVGAKSLPNDIPAAARAAWEAGDVHRAVSLLYRGAICWLVECGDVRIRESDTENDCLARTRKSLRDPARSEFFAEITDLWILQAYGNIPPDEPVFQKACDRWLFGLDQQPNPAAPDAGNFDPLPTT